MTRALAGALSALLLLGAAPAAAQPAPARPAGLVEYVVDPAASAVEFGVRHFGVRTVTGRFGRFAATFAWDPANPAASRVTATIDAATVDTGNGRRDAHLREEDFFWVERHPTITFASRSVERLDSGALRIVGDLSIRGVTRPVVLEARLEESTAAGGRTVLAWTATGTIDRRDYGLVWNRATEAGGWVVGDDVRIALAVRAASAPPGR